jgi:peptidoglycan hydrolase-like protein with peptidoglycan-binding domain
MTGEDVRTLQRVLNSATDTRVASSGAGSPGSETTRFGAATKAAVQRFQVKYGLAQSGDAAYGFVGPKTRAKVNEILASL